MRYKGVKACFPGEDSVRDGVEEIETLRQEMDRFALMTSHELQEPLRMVTGYLSLLQKRMRGRLDAKESLYLGEAVAGADRMQQMLSDFTTYARLQSRAMDLAEVDLNICCQKALQSLAFARLESGAVVMCDALPTIHGDERQLTQLFTQLISNAFKFCPRDRSPQVHIGSSYAESDGAWIVFVEDDGVGISPSDYPRLFQPFSRLHSRGEFPGAGLGLAMVRRIAGNHGGRVWIEASESQRTVFKVELPE